MNNNYWIITTGLFLAIISVLLTLFQGCASLSTQYMRQKAVKGELTWSYDKGLFISKDSMMVCSDDWDGLAKEVSCIPEAEALAISAKNNHTTGVVIQWAGISMISAGIILGFTSPTIDDGMSLIGGGYVIGLAVGFLGSYLELEGRAQAIDAFNIYNYRFNQNPECVNDSTISSHNSNKNVK